MMDECIFCHQPLLGDSLIVTLTAKGCQGIAQASETRGDQTHTVPGQRVHIECRKVYCNPKSIAASTRKRTLEAGTSSSKCILRSSEPIYEYKTHCIFCGHPDTYDHRKHMRKVKGHKLVKVQTDEFQREIEKVCDTRADSWSEIVKGRINSVNDLFAADTLYHQVCSVNFRTNKSIPQQFTADEDHLPAKRGRPRDTEQTEAFLKVAAYIEENDDEQTTINNLIEKMSDYLVGTDNIPYHFTYMKEQLKEHFGDEIVISEINGKQNVVTLRKKASAILHEFYNQKKLEDAGAEKMRIIGTAAKLIKTDIQSVTQSKETYASMHELSSVEEAISFLPDSLRLLLHNLFPSQGQRVKLASLGHSIMQATRPRTILAPLHVGLGVQLHHHFASKFLIESLNKHGFCCSYSEVQKFGRSAAMAQGTDIPGYTTNHFVQYVADNVDHNIRTIDGMNTFHGMGMIASITPGTENHQRILRVAVTAEDIARIGTVNIAPFMSANNGMKSMTYEELPGFTADPDPTAILDELWKVSLSVRSPRPAWSGLMQMVHTGDHPGQSSVLFLPMIDMDPGNMSCVQSTLQFICQHASRHKVTPVITFDQPLWWKALEVIESQPVDSEMRSIVLRLGGFHTEMSFVGSIGHIMAGSGLQELLETIYANNTVTHMLNGKAIQRAVRGLLLVDAALNAMMVSAEFNIPLPCIGPRGNAVDVEDDVNANEGLDSAQAATQHDPNDDATLSDLEKIGNLYDGLLTGKSTVEEACQSEELIRVTDRLQTAQQSMKSSRTAKLWLQFMKMMEILRKFLKGERLGMWELHMTAMHEMMPYLAASGHNLYTKCLHVYLQHMTKLPETSPEVHRHFSQGLHVVRRSDRLWAGLSADLVIEQVLMRSMKTSGGLTRGRGMTEVQRVVWLLSHPLCSEVNNAMQQLTGVNYNTSEQHKDVTKSRQAKDMTDTCELLEFLETRNPFSDNKSLRNIATGVNADDRVNSDDARDVGDKILTSMVDKHVLDYTFRKTNQTVTMSTSVVKINNETVHIDSQLLFQRLITAGTRADQLQDILKFELCSFPPAIFEAKHIMRPANKPALADALWTLMPEDVAEPIGDNQYVLDGGSLLHRIPWSSGTTYIHICRQYTDYVTRKYGRAVIVFDGYEEDLSTKDSAQQRRSCGRVGPTVEFTRDMVMKSKKDEFLSNKRNKQHFINMLSERLQEAGCRTCHATGDADVLIAQTAVGCADIGQTILVGDDTDLLVLLCYHVKDGSHNIFFRPEPKAGKKKTPRCWDIKALQRFLGRNVSNYLLFAHAMLGCDTTSRVFGIGKGVVIKHMLNATDFKSHAGVFLDEDATQSEIVDAGEKCLVSILKGTPEETLDQLRLQRFHQKVATNKSAVQPETLPPTSAATKYHSLRVYYQVQVWKGVTDISPQGYGWTVVDGKLLPFQCDLDVAPKMLLEVVRCNCKAGCENLRCTCRKAGLDCSTACGQCKGICSNMSAQITDDVVDDDTDDNV